LAVIGADPVLWIDAATIVETGFWAAPNVVGWNATLTATAPSYPNVRIALWSTFVRPEWFTSDGIHPTAAGVAARVQFVVDSLIANFPRRGG
jgi:lysophospholipase L1-like esterase